MKKLNDTTIRMQLVRRYLNAETTIEEEQMLRQYYAQTDEVLTPEEYDVRLLLFSSANLAGEFALSEEKADEFDRLMQEGRSKKSRYVAIRWVASVAAAVICAVLFFPAIHIDKTEEKPGTAILLAEKKVPRHECSENIMERKNRIETPEVNDISTSELLETVRFLSGIGTDDIIITASSGNEGFVVKTMDSNGPSTSYMLKRCSDGTSIELKSH